MQLFYGAAVDGGTLESRNKLYSVAPYILLSDLYNIKSVLVFFEMIEYIRKFQRRIM